MQLPYPRNGRRFARSDSAAGAMNFLGAHNKMASLMPTVTRLIALQKDCATTLPAMFHNCHVLNLEMGNLTFAVPNAALASKLKQQLPKLQGELLALGWQVNAIRLKVQVPIPIPPAPVITQRQLSNQAITSFSTLLRDLGDGGQNADLKAAILALLKSGNRKPESM